MGSFTIYIISLSWMGGQQTLICRYKNPSFPRNRVVFGWAIDDILALLCSINAGLEKTSRTPLRPQGKTRENGLSSALNQPCSVPFRRKTEFVYILVSAEYIFCSQHWYNTAYLHYLLSNNSAEKQCKQNSLSISSFHSFSDILVNKEERNFVNYLFIWSD